MTPPTATTTRSRPLSADHRGARGRTHPRGRRAVAARRRRRVTQLLVALAGIGIVVALALPMAKREVVTEFGLPLRYASAIRVQSAQKHVSPALVAAVIYAETKFRTGITSPTGAEGPMQVEPQTALYLARRSGATAFSVADLQHPATNIAYGTYYLRSLLNAYHGSRVLALAAYNGGGSNVDRWEAVALAHGHTLRISDIPFPETRAYVTKVLHAEAEYRHRYASQLGYG